MDESLFKIYGKSVSSKMHLLLIETLTRVQRFKYDYHISDCLRCKCKLQ